MATCSPHPHWTQSSFMHSNLQPLPPPTKTVLRHLFQITWWKLSLAFWVPPCTHFNNKLSKLKASNIGFIALMTKRDRECLFALSKSPLCTGHHTPQHDCDASRWRSLPFLFLPHHQHFSWSRRHSAPEWTWLPYVSSQKHPLSPWMSPPLLWK